MFEAGSLRVHRLSRPSAKARKWQLDVGSKLHLSGSSLDWRLWQSQRYSAFQGRALERERRVKMSPSERKATLAFDRCGACEINSLDGLFDRSDFLKREKASVVDEATNPGGGIELLDS